MNALWIHLTNLVILYTADRTAVLADGKWVAIYTGARQSVDLTLGDPKERLSDDAQAGVSSLLKLVEWTYDPRWSADRLPLVQIGVVQALHAADPTVRYRLLLHNATSILDGLQWHWKAFIEGKVDAYIAQVRALEDYVAKTAQAFADQVSTMINGLSDTMLAAVGALLGSFIAALFKDKFNPTIFVIGMGVYAVYVLVFPLCYNMLNQWGCYRTLVEEFEIWRRRFEERIYPERVDEIVGARITNSRTRFKRWFITIFVTYIVVITLAIVTALIVPSVVGPRIFSPILTPTPMP